MTPDREAVERMEKSLDEPCKMSGSVLFCEVRQADLRALLSRLKEWEEAGTAVLARDAKWAPSGAPNDCACINLNRDAEREYETGTCPHQRIRSLLKGST